MTATSRDAIPLYVDRRLTRISRATIELNDVEIPRKKEEDEREVFH